jgi:thiol-disulfide isomerase/thioredoxin
MKRVTSIALLFMISTSIFSQSVLPSALKGNWLNANDSIEWIISFMPGFAAYDTQFWLYETIETANNGYKIVLSNETGKHQINAGIKDNGSLLLTVGKQKPMQCTRKKTLQPDFSSHLAPPFSGSLLNDDTVNIRGFIEDYDPELYGGAGNVQYLNTLTRFTKTHDHHFEIAPDGRFEVKFRAFSPQMIYFTIEGSTQTRMFIVPGEAQMIGFNNTLAEVTLDPRKWEVLEDFEINHYMGHSGMLSEETLYLDSFYRNNLISGFTKATNMELMPQLTYIRWRKEVYAYETKSMDSLTTALNTSERARQVMNSELETDLLADIYTYQINMGNIKQYSHRYMDEMPPMDYHSQKYLLSGKYSTINNYMTFFNNYQDISTYKSLATFFMLNYISDSRAEGVDTLSINDFRNELSDLESISDNIPFTEESFQYDSTLNSNSAIFWKPYNDLLQKYYDVIPDSIKIQARINELNYALNKFGDGISGQMYSMFWLMLTQKNTSLDEQLIHWAKQHITEPVLLNFLLEDHAEKKEAENRYSTYADGTIIIDSLPSIAGSDAFFDEILARFKGKVVYIDFWADWCSPCRAEIKPAAKLKEEYKDKDIAFLYFGMSCKKPDWQKTIMQEQMEGYHYWLDRNQGNVLAGKFGITGIPHYLLVDKSGKILEGQPPRPSNRTEIREKLDELLQP